MAGLSLFMRDNETVATLVITSLQCLEFWVKFSTNKVLKYFSQEMGFTFSCKLSPLETVCKKCQILFPMETICMKCQIQFPGKKKKNTISFVSAELAKSVIKVKYSYFQF